MLVAVPIDRRALDVLHREPGQAVLGDPAVHEAGDAGVIEQRKDLPLLEEPADEGVARRTGAHQLQCDALAELRVVALGEVHRAHAAAAQLAQDAVRPDPLGRQRGLAELVRGEQAGRELGGWPRKEALRLLHEAEQPHHDGARLGAHVGARDESGPRVGRPVERRFQQRVRLAPALGRELPHGSLRSGSWPVSPAPPDSSVSSDSSA